MRITFPPMGYLSYPLTYMLQDLGLDACPPAPITKRTLELGVRHAPEGACLPYKVTLGSFLEGLEGGADNFVTMGGAGKCRFGFYGPLQELTLGIQKEVKFHTIDTERILGDLHRLLREWAPDAGRLAIARSIALAIYKLRAIDELGTAKRYYGPRSRCADRMLDMAEYGSHELAECGNFGDVARVKDTVLDVMRSYQAGDLPTPPKVVIVGEFYVLLEPYTNHWLENSLIRLGIETVKFVQTGSWAFAKTLLQHIGMFDEQKECLAAAQPYFHYHVGGEGLKSVGIAATCAKRGFDGVIHLRPFGCMPEVVAEFGLRKLCEDYQLPLLTVSLDEHASPTGLATRLEAYADCLKRRSAGPVRPL